MKTNRESLVVLSVQGQIHHPLGGSARVTSEGRVAAVPAIGGITYNVKVGDPVFGLTGDHIEPGVSIKNMNTSESDALNVFSCIGNRARVVSGKAEGAVGYVTGIHGGCEHVIIHFPQEVLYRLKINDEILVESRGQGLKIEECPDIIVQSLDPDLLEQMGIVTDGAGGLTLPVAAEIPSYLMGSGLGAAHSYSGDYDLMTSDWEAVKKHRLEKLRFGDIVLLKDCDNTFGRGYLEGARTVGIVIHGDCIAHGHGPGITTVLTTKLPIIHGQPAGSANIADFILSRSYDSGATESERS